MATTDIATRTPTQKLIARVRSDEFKREVALALPAHIRPERFVRATVTAIIQNPEVTTHPESLFQAAIKAAQDGLLPDGREAAFVMFKKDGEKKVVYMPMVGGFRKIAAKHGITLVADVVHAGDAFVWSKLPPTLEHVPVLEADKQGEIVCAYAAAYDRDWRFVTAPAVMNVPEIEKVRAVSRAANEPQGPWVKWWERMACKTVARRLFHELPLADLDEYDMRIVEQADVDADLPELGLTADEADVAAQLSGALPPDDKGPDDSSPPARSSGPDQSAPDRSAPDRTLTEFEYAPDRSAETEAAFAAALERLNALDAETDWRETAEKAAVDAYQHPLAALNDNELWAITRQMLDVVDKLEPKS